jgi:four helix bundle protein
MGENRVQQKSFEFALSIVRLYKKLQARQEFIVSPQLLRSGTGIGVSVEEAQSELNQERYLDYWLTAARGARETRYWLRLLQESKLADVDVSKEIALVDELLHLLSHPD